MSEFPVGTARIDLRVDDAQVAPALERGRAAVEGFSGSMRQALAPARALASAARTLGAAVGAITAVANSVRVVMEYVRDVFGSGTEKAREFGESLTRVFSGNLERDVRSATENVEKLQTRLSEVNAEIAWAREHPILSIFAGRSMETMTDEAEELKRMLGEAARLRRALSDRLVEQRETKALEEAVERISEIRHKMRLEASGLTAEEIAARTMFANLRKLTDTVNDPERKRRIEEELFALNLAYEEVIRFRRRKEDEERERRIEKEREAAERIAREQAETIGRRIRESLVEAFDLRHIATSVEQALAVLRLIASSPRRML